LGELEPPAEGSEEDAGKGKKGKKGKGGKGGDDGGAAKIAMPLEEEMGEPISKENFVALVAHSYLGAQSMDASPEEIALSLALLDDLVSEFLELSRGSAPPPPEPEPPAPREVPSPPPMSINRIKENVDLRLASILIGTWDSAVEDYIDSLKCAFGELAALRSARVGHFSTVREQFHAYIERASMGQSAVMELHQSINKIPMDMRYHDDVKSELHERVADTVQTLSAIIEERERQSSEDLAALRSDGFVDYHANQVVQIYASLVQAEVDRFHTTHRVLVDAFVGSQGGGAGCKLSDTKGGEATSVEGGDDPAFPENPPVFLASLFGKTGGDDEAKEDSKGKKGKDKGKSKGKGKGKKGAVEEDADAVDASDPVSVLRTMVSSIEAYLKAAEAAEATRRMLAKKELAEERERALAEVDAAAAGGKGGKGKDKKGGATPDAAADDVGDEAGLDDLTRALAYETKCLRGRIARLVKVCERVINDEKAYTRSFFETLGERSVMRFAEERANLVSLSDYVLSQVEAEEPMWLLTGLMNTDKSVVQRQMTVTRGPIGPIASGPPKTSWTGPRGTTYFVDSRVGMVKPDDPPVPPAIESFSDAALAPSQAANLRSAFENALAQVGEENVGSAKNRLGVDAAIRLLKSLGASGDLPVQWSSLAYEDLRAFVVKFVDDAETRTVDWNSLVTSLPVAGGEEHGAALKMQSIMRRKRAKERVEDQRALKAAEAKFDELDGDGNSNGFLDGDEISVLADWVWESFHPGGKPIDEAKRAELKATLTQRVSDAPNGQISFDAFEQWFRKVSEDMRRFNSFNAKKKGGKQ
jgi:hypothetical protein